MMLKDFRHQNISIFADLDTLKREERARRRILRIQQVRQQSKLIASQVIAKTRYLRETEQLYLKEKKEKQLKQWKHQRLSCLKEELNNGLHDIGKSFKAADAELLELNEKEKLKVEQENIARKRGLAAAREAQQALEEKRLQEERKLGDRLEARFVENLRAKAIASLPPSISAPNENAATSSLTRQATDRSGRKVEVYNFSQPIPNQFCIISNNVVERVSPSTCKDSAVVEAKKELQVHAEKDKEIGKQKKLVSWLGEAAETRLTLKKEYHQFVAELNFLAQREAATRTGTQITLEEIAVIENNYRRGKEMSNQPPVPSVNTETENSLQAVSPSSDKQDAGLTRQDLTAFPLAQFTAEEKGALGGTATSLYALLSSLSDESRRRLQAVVDDEFVFNDDDFDEPSPSPPASPEPPIPSGKSKLTVDVKTTHQVTVEGPSSPASVTSTSEVSVTLTTKSKSKRRKKKSKSKSITVDQTSDNNGQKALTTPVEETEEETKHLETANVVNEKQKLKDREHLVSKSVEIDDFGVAYIKKTEIPTCNKEHIPRISHTAMLKECDTQKDSLYVEKSISEEASFKYNKNSFVSNSTQYHSPPEDMLADQNIEKYLKSIEKEKEQVEAFIHSKSKAVQTSKDIILPKYINKLLTMTRDSVEQLSVSDVTETSSELSRTDHKKKKRRKKTKSKSNESSTSSGMTTNSPRTEDSHVTLSVPSPGVPVASAANVSESSSQISFPSEDSNLKFSESSSTKESSNSAPKLNHEDNKIISSPDFDSTAYLTLQDLSSRAIGKPTLVPVKISTETAKDSTDACKVSLTNDLLDQLFRPDVPAMNARLSTIIEADSSAAADDVSIGVDKGEKADSSDSVLDVEEELRKRGLPTLGSTSVTHKLLSPELERQLQDMKVTPWGSNMIARMKKANSLSSSSEDVAPPLSESSDVIGQIEHGISHSTPLSLEGVTVADVTYGSQSQIFFLHDTVVSPIAPIEEKGSRSLSS